MGMSCIKDCENVEEHADVAYLRKRNVLEDMIAEKDREAAQSAKSQDHAEKP